MTATEIEKAVIQRLLGDSSLSPLRSSIRWDTIEVKSRSMTGAGFLTEFKSSPELRLFKEGTNLRWGKAGARLNDAGVETGYVIYVDDGQVTGIEGYTYGDEWPTHIDRVELYDTRSGMELRNPPKP